MKNPHLTWNKWGLYLAFAIPILLLFYVFFSNRSLFLDSLNLARNISESSFFELLLPLKYEQSAPLLFLYISKITTLIFGVSEYSLRALPMVSGIACLYFFAKNLKHLLHSRYVAIGLFWLGTQSMFVRYSTEFKQYITDAFVSVFIIWLALSIDKLTNKTIVYVGILGAIMIWLSMPAIFVLIGMLAYYAHIHYKSDTTQLPILLLSIWFALNFVAEYFMILSPAIESNHMQNYHENYFIQGSFWRLHSLRHDFGLIISTIRMTVGKSGIAICIALLLIILSIADFVKNRKSVGLLLLLPITAVFGASLLGQYSLIERLILFTLPIIMILVLIGGQVVVRKLSDKNVWLRYAVFGIIGIAFSISLIQTNGLKYILQPFEKEDNRSSLQYISQHEKSENPIICSQHAFPAYSYYINYDVNHKQLILGQPIAAKYGDSIIELAKTYSNKNKEEVWILMGHMSENDISNLINGPTESR